MLIIGLVGGTEARRDAVADAFVKVGKPRLGLFALRSNADGEGRAKLLDQVVLKFSGGKFKGNGLILSHVLTAEEADLIRKNGGYLLHVDGVPSSCIPIRRNDLMVTAKPGGDRHYLDPLEALSEITQRSSRVA